MPPLIVIAAVIENQDRILITRRLDGTRFAGLWEFPGGKLETGETPAEGLRREIREELDLEIAVGAICEVVHHRYDWGAVLILAYHCRTRQTTIRNLGVAEHRWVARHELSDYPFLAADHPIVATLQRQVPD